MASDVLTLLELLQSVHHKGLSLEQVWSDDDAFSARAAAGAAFLQEGAPPLQQTTAEMWFSLLKAKENTIVPLQEAHEFQALHERWRSDQERHALCKRALSRNLFLRLLAFISDLVDYRDSQDAQQRMDFLLPTAAALFDSPLYFPQQPQDGRILSSFLAPNGLTVSRTLAAQFERAPRLEGVCTAHTLAPLLKRLFAIDDDSFNSKEFKEFRKEFNRAANVKLRPICTGNSNSKQHPHHKQAARSKKQPPQKENEKKKSKHRGQ